MSDARPKTALCTVIEFMKSHEELWNFSSKAYSNRALRAVFLNRCVELLSEQVPGVTPSLITARIRTLKGRYSKERRKLTASAKSGAGVADLEISTWWCFDSFRLLSAGEVNVRAFCHQYGSRRQPASSDYLFQYLAIKIYVLLSDM